MIKLKEVKGLLPDKWNGQCVCDCIPCKTDGCEGCDLGLVGRSDKYTNGELCYERCCCDDTQNKVVDQIGEVRIGLNRDKLRDLIYKCHLSNLEKGLGSRKSPAEMDGIIADAIISQLPQLLEVVTDK